MNWMFLTVEIYWIIIFNYRDSSQQVLKEQFIVGFTNALLVLNGYVKGPEPFSRFRQLNTIPFTASLEHCPEKHQTFDILSLAAGRCFHCHFLKLPLKTSKGRWWQADSCAVGQAGWSRCWPPSCTCLTCPPRPPDKEKCMVYLDLYQKIVRPLRTFFGKDAMWKCTDLMQHCIV